MGTGTHDTDAQDPIIVAQGFARAFLAGTLSDDAYLAELYEGTSLDVLRDWSDAPAYTQGDPLGFLLACDLGTPSGRLDTLHLLGEFLSVHGAPPDRTAEMRAGDEYDVLLAATPAWVDVPANLAADLLSDTASLGDRERVQVVRDRIRARFPSLGRPPRWLQSPAWPVIDQVPATFVGQLDLGTLRHDTSAVFVFLHRPSGQIVTVEQSA